MSEVQIRNTGTFTSFFKDTVKSHKEVTKPSEIKVFLTISYAGSVLVTNGSGCGSGRPQKILRIRRIRMQIRNTVTITSFFKDTVKSHKEVKKQ